MERLNEVSTKHSSAYMCNNTPCLTSLMLRPSITNEKETLNNKVKGSGLTLAKLNIHEHLCQHEHH